MAKQSFTIQGIHRDAVSALRHASQLQQEFGGEVETTNVGTRYTFQVFPNVRLMWRVIVGYPYLLNHKRGKSPDSRTVKAIYYDKTKELVKAEIPRLRKEALRAIRQIKNSWIQDDPYHPLYRKINVSVSQVEYDVRLIGITQYLDD
jgi:hypothetical protein